MDDSGSITSVHILGEEYRIRGASPERIAALAEYVNARFRELEGSGAARDLKRQAVLVSLNIAEEIFDAREEQGRTLEEIGDRLRKCRKQLEFENNPDEGDRNPRIR